jgi:hypothetical protein
MPNSKKSDLIVVKKTTKEVLNKLRKDSTYDEAIRKLLEDLKITSRLTGGEV